MLVILSSAASRRNAGAPSLNVLSLLLALVLATMTAPVAAAVTCGTAGSANFMGSDELYAAARCFHDGSECDNSALPAAAQSSKAKVQAYYGAVMNDWCVGQVSSFDYLFYQLNLFNEPIGDWDTSSATTMFFTFAESGFNQPIDSWDVSKVQSMNGLFKSSPFDQPLASWDVSKVNDFTDTFNFAYNFEQDLSSWDVSSAEFMERMFRGIDTYIGEIKDWNVAKVQSFNGMFAFNSGFNQNIGKWDVSACDDFSSMFHYATAFDQDLSGWDVKAGCRFNKMFTNAASFSRDLNSWHAQVTTQSTCSFPCTFNKMFVDSQCPIQTDPVPGPFCQPFRLRACLRKAYKNQNCSCDNKTECLTKLTDSCSASFLAAGGTLATFNNKASQLFDAKCT